MNACDKALGDVATIIMGQSPPGDSYNPDGEGLPLLNGPTEFGLTHPACTLYTTDSRRDCEPGDLIFCVRGNTAGRMNWADQQYSLGRGVCAFRGQTPNDTRYLRYAMEYGLTSLLQRASGSTMPNLTQEVISTFAIAYRPNRVKIAAILSAYDDLIEVNARRIAILEEMARGLYREWFVRFRFPGHEGARMVESAAGVVLEGWEARLLSDFVEIHRENVNPGQFPDETFAHFSIPAYDEGCMPVLEKGESIKSGKFLLSGPCVLLSKLNPRIPRVWFAEPEAVNRAISSSEFLVLTPRPPANRVFLYTMCSSQEFLDTIAGLALGTSTSHQRAKPDDLLKLSWTLPSALLMAEFARQVEPMLDLIRLLRSKNANLRRTRDLLLPRLVAGAVDVAGMELDTRGEP